MSSPMPTTKRRVDLDGPDFYPTPAWATEALLRVESFQGGIMEPACGDGAISKVLQKAGYEIESSDLYDRGFGLYGGDFLLMTQGKFPVLNIVTNPPYILAEKFVLKALEIAQRKVALFLRLAFFESDTRYEAIFARTPPIRAWAFSQRVTMYPNGVQTAGTGTTAYAWFVWESENGSFLREGASTPVGWIPPGSKPKAEKRERPEIGLSLSDLGLQ